LAKLTGTGLAYPKIIGDPESFNIRGRIREPNTSRCGTGFRLSLPARFAVGSPMIRAA
jgi:hypothetical protein